LVHVEAFVALGEEGDKGYARDGAGFEDDSGPGDFEAGVLDVDLGERGVLAAVPGLVFRTEGEEREHSLAADDPHLAGVLLALLYCAKGVDAFGGSELVPRPTNGIGKAEGAGGAEDAEAVEVSAFFSEAFEGVLDPFDVRGLFAGVFFGPEERDFGSVVGADFGVYIGVRGENDGFEDAALDRGGDGVGDDRMAGERPDVFVGDALGAGTGWD
jgi:hypothetical protein